ASMAYVLVMGGLALSVSFTLGWALWRLLRWMLGWLSGGPKARGRAKVKPRSRQPKAAPKRQAKAPARARPAPRRPWRLTRWLAGRTSALPLASLTLLLYAFTRLAAFGMTRRPLEAPAGFHALVEGLGWAAAVLLGMALVHLLARWRCHG
ncbi:hypothetical protein, partial [Staphylococcus aureus]|uniref:hypothetical protein n=1 Tax=Staphylococcus aureus TaxID=1280 RepID=UPI00301BA437